MSVSCLPVERDQTQTDQMGDNATSDGPLASFRVVLRGFRWPLGRMSNMMDKIDTETDARVGDPGTN